MGLPPLWPMQVNSTANHYGKKLSVMYERNKTVQINCMHERHEAEDSLCVTIGTFQTKEMENEVA